MKQKCGLLLIAATLAATVGQFSDAAETIPQPTGESSNIIVTPQRKYVPHKILY